MVKKIGDKSCQSNFDKRSSDFGSFLVTYNSYCMYKVIHLITAILARTHQYTIVHKKVRKCFDSMHVHYNDFSNAYF